MVDRIVLGFALFLSFGGSNLCADTGKVFESYRQAQNAYEYGEYKKAIVLFQQLLYPKPGKIHDILRQRDAHKLLGLSYYFLGDMPHAKEEFLHYLYRQPDARFDPALYPPNLIRFFESIRTRHRQTLKNLLQSKQKIPSKVKVETVVIRLEKQIHYIHPFLNFLPFGTPQFIRKQPWFGAVLLAGEVVCLGLNVASYWFILSKQERESNDPSLRGRFYPEDIGMVKAFQIAQFVSFAAFGIFIGIGIIDGFLFTPRRFESLLPSSLPKLDLERRDVGSSEIVRFFAIQ